ncbi:ABC transporter ATP-binding protein [Saccharospirillum impatiens]|uniref:ABC transporter ATP-binding protein n=1 Tax=Saccharospirillum impatiens TaxID=169438 RepID=UPI0003FF6C56|nr:ABC transporter ATP-binding protein [Saccharospirillum impatiens]
MLRLNQVVKQFAQPDGDVTVLNGANFHLPVGRSAALLGESGSGKSTLLHLIAGLDTPDSGDLTIDGRSSLTLHTNDWNRLRRDRLSLIFQQYHLVPTLTVLDNLQLQARLSHRLDTAFRDHLIDRLGLDGLTRRLPHQLSGGQQQRVAIARALLHRPALVLADEPTGNLDEDTSERVMGVLVDLVRETGSSLLMVTHSAHMAGFLDEQWRLQHGQLRRLSGA